MAAIDAGALVCTHHPTPRPLGGEIEQERGRSFLGCVIDCGQHGCSGGIQQRGDVFAQAQGRQQGGDLRIMMQWNAQ